MRAKSTHYFILLIFWERKSIPSGRHITLSCPRFERFWIQLFHESSVEMEYDKRLIFSPPFLFICFRTLEKYVHPYQCLNRCWCLIDSVLFRVRHTGYSIARSIFSSANALDGWVVPMFLVLLLNFVDPPHSVNEEPQVIFMIFSGGRPTQLSPHH
jgi:hypothetical protein